MEPVDPRVPLEFVPPGSRAVIKAKDQPQYQALPSIHTPSGTVITRWALTDEERQRLVDGEDLYLTIRTFNSPLQPVFLGVGLSDWREL